MPREPVAPPELIDRLRRELAATGELTLVLRVRAGKRETRVIPDALPDVDLVLDIESPPQDDRANREVLRFVAELCGVTHREVSLDHGRSSPRKILRVRRPGA